MAKVVVKSKVKKIKKKFPVEIRAPEFLKSTKVGTSNVTDLSALVGKTSKVNLMYITGNVKNQNIRLTLIVDEVASGLAKTRVKMYEQISYYLGRFVKKGSDLVEDSFVCETKDHVKVRIKPFIVTKQNASTLTKNLLRAENKKLLTSEIAKTSYDDLISSVIQSKIQTTLRNELKKIFPLKVYEFRKVGME